MIEPRFLIIQDKVYLVNVEFNEKAEITSVTGAYQCVSTVGMSVTDFVGALMSTCARALNGKSTLHFNDLPKSVQDSIIVASPVEAVSDESGKEL